MKRSLFIGLTAVFVGVGGAAPFQGFDFKKVKPPAGVPGIPGQVQKSAEMAPQVGDIIQGFAGIPLEEELNIGGSVAIEIVARYGGVLKDTNATQRVNLLGRSLALYGRRPELVYRFGILNSDEVNAFSAPGGYVFITKGLYDLAATEDQLAGILAHEICHITERHALEIISRNKMFSAGFKIAAANDRNFAAFSQGIEAFTKVLFEKGFDPNTEFQADREARRLTGLTGFDQNGLKQVLQQLAETKPSSRKIFSTHPPARERIQKLDEAGTSDKPAPARKKFKLF